MKKIVKQEKECRSAEAASSNILSGSLDDELIVELEQSAAHVRNAARGFVDNVKTAGFQADSFIMGRVVNATVSGQCSRQKLKHAKEKSNGKIIHERMGAIEETINAQVHELK